MSAWVLLSLNTRKACKLGSPVHEFQTVDDPPLICQVLLQTWTSFLRPRRIYPILKLSRLRGLTIWLHKLFRRRQLLYKILLALFKVLKVILHEMISLKTFLLKRRGFVCYTGQHAFLQQRYMTREPYNNAEGFLTQFKNKQQVGWYALAYETA